MLKAVLFDLDGTLLPMDEKKFTEYYFGLLCKKLEPLGYDKEKLIKTIWAGTSLMIKNDGGLTNEKVFWQHFADVYGKDKLSDKRVFDDFYVTEFKRAKIVCGENPDARKIIDYAKSLKLKIILASNPVFPIAGLLTRAEFVGLNDKDFDYVSGYENSGYAKPNPDYYKEILNTNRLAAEEAIYFGNSKTEDFDPAESAGIKCFLVNSDRLQYDYFVSAMNGVK